MAPRNAVGQPAYSIRRRSVSTCARRTRGGGTSAGAAGGKPRPGLTWKPMGSVDTSPDATDAQPYAADGTQATPAPQHRL
jgi:hypothetical protein